MFDPSEYGIGYSMTTADAWNLYFDLYFLNVYI